MGRSLQNPLVYKTQNANHIKYFVVVTKTIQYSKKSYNSEKKNSDTLE